MTKLIIHHSSNTFMFLAFTLILLFVAAGILASVYSFFFPFMQNLGTVTSYHTAYYGAISAVERAELVLKYRSPWFSGSAGFTWTTSFGPLSDYTPELMSDDDAWLRWNINSRTQSIPASGKGNADFMLATWDSANYNQLGYTNLETFLLSYDAVNYVTGYYTWVQNIVYLTADFIPVPITWIFRLPPKVYSGFWWAWKGELCNVCDSDGNGTYNDIVLSWSLEWLHNGIGFKIFPSTSTSDTWLIYANLDNAIRKSNINPIPSSIKFQNSMTPLPTIPNDIQHHNVVSSDAAAIENSWFSAILNANNGFTWLRLSFGAVNLFATTNGSIYPYLEYQFTFPKPVSDRYYTIQWYGLVWEYKVLILLKKPTVQGTVGGDFTVIF